MRNLKKILALVLALAMSLSLVTIASGIDLGDAEDIDHTEAVEVLTTLGVIQGYEDGNYYPDRVVKRSEMAKMITYILTGGKEPVLDSSNVSFGDTKGHWAAGYIEYCAAQGILNGYEDGNFYPERTVTASEAAKMILVTMNYDSKVFGFTGAGWAVNVAVEANKAGLYDELLGTNPSDGLDRDATAQMLYNGITQLTMRLQYNHNIETGEVTQTYVLEGPTLLADKFNARIEIGVLTGLDGNGKGFTVTDLDNGNTTQIGNNPPESYHTAVRNTDYTEDLSSLLGEEVRVVVRRQASKDAVLGVFATGVSQVAYTTWNAIEQNSTRTEKITFGGSSYDIERPQSDYDADEDEMIVYADGNRLAAQTAGYFTNTNRNDTVKLVDIDGNGKYDIAYVTTVQMAKVTYAGSESITVQFLTDNRGVVDPTEDREDVVVYDGIAKDDYVAIYEDLYTGKPTYTEAAVATGTITGERTVVIHGVDVDQYLIDGAWYEVADHATVNLQAGDTIDYVADANLIYTAEVTSGAAGLGSLAMVVTTDVVNDFGDSGAGTLDADVVKAKLLFADGSTSVETIAKVGTNEIDENEENVVSALIGELVAFTINSDGNYELSTIPADKTSAELDMIRGFDGSGSTAYYVDASESIGGIELADDAVVFVLTAAAKNPNAANKGAVYTGKEIKNAFDTNFGTGTADAGLAASLYVTENGFQVAKAAVLYTNTAFSIASGSNYGYLTLNSYRDNEGYEVYNIFDGENTIQARQKGGKALLAGTVITYDVVSDTEVKNVNVPNNIVTGAVTGWDGNRYIAFDEGIRREIGQDTAIIYVDSAKKEAAEGGSISIAVKPDGNNYRNNVRYIANGTDVLFLLVDVNSDMKAAPNATTLGASASVTDIENALSNGAPVTLDAEMDNAITSLTIQDGQTLNITADQDMVHTITVADGGTLNISAKMADNSTVTAEPGATISRQGYEIVGEKGLTSTADITVKAISSGKTEITLAAAATLNGLLEVTAGDALKGNFEVKGTNGAKIVVYGGSHSAFEWKYAKLTVNAGADNADIVASAATLPATADQVYTWSTGDDATPLSGWVVSARS